MTLSVISNFGIYSCVVFLGIYTHSQGKVCCFYLHYTQSSLNTTSLLTLNGGFPHIKQFCRMSYSLTESWHFLGIGSDLTG